MIASLTTFIVLVVTGIFFAYALFDSFKVKK